MIVLDYKRPQYRFFSMPMCVHTPTTHDPKNICYLYFSESISVISKPCFLLTLLLLVISGHLLVHAQTKKIDALTRSIASASSDKEKADLYFELAENLYTHNFDKGLENAEQSLALATQAKYTRGIAQALTSIGTYHYYKGQNQKSCDYYYRALRVVKNSETEDYPVKTYLRLSIVYRQQAYFDSAKIYLNKAEASIKNQKVGSLHASLYASSGILANAMSHNDEALALLKRALNIRVLSNDSVRLADTWRNIGAVYTDLSMYDSAEYCYHQASMLIANINDPEIHMTLSLSRGETNFVRGNFNEAIANYQEALDRMKSNTYKRYYAYLLYKIGELYENQGVYHTAYDYLFNSLKEFEAINARQDMALAYTQIGWCYSYQQNYSLAIDNANRSAAIAATIQDSAHMAQNNNLIGYALLKTGKPQQALAHLEDALAMRKKIKHWWGVSYTLYNTALVRIELGEIKKAYQLLFEALETNKKIGNKGGMVFICNELGLLYAKNKQYDKAAFYLNQAKELALKIPLPTQLIVNYKNYIFLSEAKRNNQQTIEYYKLYTQLKDSLSEEISSGRIAKADALFQLQKKANEIQLIHKENELQEEKIGHQQDEIAFQKKIILIVTISLVVLIILLITIYQLLKARTRAKEILKKQNKEILEQQEEIQAQSEELAESNSTLATLNHELKEKNHEIEQQSEKIREANLNLEKKVDERTSQLNIAYHELETFFYRTSHDFRRPLTTYLGLAEIAKATVQDKQAIDLFEKVRETTIGLDAMLVKLQSISNIDFESQLVEYSLNQLVSECIKKFNSKIESRGIKVVAENQDYIVKINDHLFRIFLENILENSIHFSTPINPQITIRTSLSDSNINIIIEDNGQGISSTIQHRIFEMYFRGNDNSKGNGLGLYIAKRAIDKLGGTISFISRLNEGTSFKVTIPFRG